MAVTTNRYQKTLDEKDFGLTADKTLVYNTWTLVCEYTVPAQQEIAVGASEIIQGGASGKIAYIALDHTDSVAIANTSIKVVVCDANDQGQVVTDHEITEWSASETDRNAALLLHEDSRRAVEDSKIQIWAKFKDSVGTAIVDVSDAATKVRLPVTVYTIKR